MIKTLSVTEASRNFSDVVNRARYRHETTLLVKGGKPVARIVPVAPAPKTGREVAAAWRSWKRLPPEAADAFAKDVAASRTASILPRDPWA